MDGCLFCGKGPWNGAALFRVNKPGEKGVWACEKHISQTDAKVDPFVKKIVDIFQGK